MRAYTLRAAVLAAVLVIFMPSAVHAQLTDNCKQYNCDAYAYLESCSIYTPQTMSYNAEQYLPTRTLSQTFSPGHLVQTCRGDDFCNQPSTYTW
jgi:hypothetical protein